MPFNFTFYLLHICPTNAVNFLNATSPRGPNFLQKSLTSKTDFSDMFPFTPNSSIVISGF